MDTGKTHTMYPIVPPQNPAEYKAWLSQRIQKAAQSKVPRISDAEMKERLARAAGEPSPRQTKAPRTPR